MNLTEKHRPKNFNEIKGQDEIIKSIKDTIARGDLPHFLFLGTPGNGKTSTAHLIAKEVKYPIHEFNSSDERGIDVVRGKIKRLASTKGHRIILLDEMDNMTFDAQQALRRTMETTRSSIFILCGNREYKIIDPIKSRCAIHRFKRLEDRVIMQRILEICKKEGIEIKMNAETKEGLGKLVKNCRGDLRKALNMIESIVDENKKITKDTLIKWEPKIVSMSLIQALDGRFEEAKQTIEDAFIDSRFDSDTIIEEMYEGIGKLEEDDEIKIRLYTKLAETERNCKIGSNPLIQIIGFLAYAWISPHLTKIKGGERG